MTKPALTTGELALLMGLGDVLIPASATMPAFSEVPGCERNLQVAATASGATEDALRAALATLGPVSDLSGAMAMAEARPEAFQLLALLLTGAYYMAADTLRALNYPTERRNPAGVSDFADEYETGILDPVIENGRGAG